MMPSTTTGTSAAVRFCVLIPARLASQRLSEKPLADIGGVPMVVRVARRAQASGAERVVVCADHEKIVAACERHAIHAILTRADHPTGTDRLAEACQLLHLDAGAIVVNVQGDEPLMPPAVIAQVAATLAADADCDLATAAHPLHSADEFLDPNVVKVVIDAHSRALLFSRAPIPWARDEFAASRTELAPGLPALRHIGLYAYRVGFLLRYPDLARPPIEEFEKLEQLRALYHGNAIAVLRLEAPLPPGVDTPADLERIRRIVASLQEVGHGRPSGRSG
jgi:3-deoxy-manno-octulosonate cytidylyltransferase (CMP-KDO synthetase)